MSVSNETALFWGIDDFWNCDHNATVNSTDSTPWLEKSVLAWTPMLFLWLLSPLEYFYIKEAKSLSKSTEEAPINWLCKIKLDLIYLLILLNSLMCLSLALEQPWTFPDNGKWVELFTSFVNIPTLIFVKMLTLESTRCGCKSSGIIFIFWLLYSTLSVPQLSAVFCSCMKKSWDATSVLYFASRVTAFISFMANFFAETDLEKSSKECGPKQNQEKNYSFPSRVLFVWMFPIMKKGQSLIQTPEYLWKLSSENALETTYRLFKSSWNGLTSKTAKKSNNEATWINPVALALVKAFWRPFLFASFMKLVYSVTQILQTKFKNELVNSAGSGAALGAIYSLLVALASTVILNILVKAQQDYKISVVKVRVQSVLLDAIYRKAQSVSPSADTNKSLGDLVNMCAVDVTLVLEMIEYANQIWSVPFILGGCLYLMWPILGVSVLGGVLVIVVALLAHTAVSWYLANIYTKHMAVKDERCKLTEANLADFKAFKLHNWVDCMIEKIAKLRDKEVGLLKRFYYLQSLSSFIQLNCFAMVPLGVFVMYGGIFSLKLFMSVTVFFYTIGSELQCLPDVVKTFSQGKVSLRRIYNFLNAKDLLKDAVVHDSSEEKGENETNHGNRVHLKMLQMNGHGDIADQNVQDSFRAEVVTGAQTETRPLLQNEVLNPDVPEQIIHQGDAKKGEVVRIEHGHFAWKAGEACLKDINLHVKEGALVAVLGGVSSGKSSLLLAILGEMDRLHGRVITKGSSAYVPQKYWLQTSTVEDNILFGLNKNEASLEDVIEACELREDTETFLKKYNQEIGEQGKCLSGGQKQRLCLARAAVRHKDEKTRLFLLDDPLSAVDSLVGNRIFNKVIGPEGLLGKKTRIMTTQSVRHLRYADHVIIMDEGRIVASGPLEEVQKTAIGEKFLQDLVENDQNKEETVDKLMSETEKVRETPLKSSEESPTPVHDGPDPQPSSRYGSSEELIKEEGIEKGNVKSAIYLHYLRSIGGWSLTLILLLSLVQNFFTLAMSQLLLFWQAEIGNRTDENLAENMDYLVANSKGLFYVGLLTVACCSLMAKLLLDVSTQMHHAMLQGVMRSPVSFMDSNPVGRVLARFTRDVEILDFELPPLIYNFCSSFLLVFTMIVGAILVDYGLWYGIVTLTVAAMYIFCVIYYLKTSRQLRRLEAVTRSPVYTHLRDSYLGVSVIRAFKAETRFVAEFEEKVDMNQRCNYLLLMSQIFANLWMDLFGQLFALGMVVFIITDQHTKPDLFMLVFATSILPMILKDYILKLTQSSTEVNTDIVAVERIREYSLLPPEETVPETQDEDDTLTRVWPSQGKIEFKNYSTRYRSSQHLVLSNISLVIEPREKIGIVGRTGAGKSTLVLALERIVPPVRGHIFIDGVDICSVPLSRLRSSFTVIPQDPVLITGTVRMNLDPTTERTDDVNLWAALEKAHLKEFVQSLEDKLDTHIEDTGSTLSVGQKQLMCLARALLCDTKVLVLDEVTAAVDLQTERNIHETLQSEFRNCTVLTIAHRLSTVMQSDRVMVIDKGSVIEFDEPEVLKQDETKMFYKLYRKSVEGALTS